MPFTLGLSVNSVNTAGMMESMTERPYHHGALDTALVDAGVTAVRKGGMEAVVLRDLARSVGVSPSAAYRHFPSKEHLDARISQVGREQLGEALITARDSVTGTRATAKRAVDQFAAIGRAYVDFALENPRLFEAAFARYDAPPPDADDPDAWRVLVNGVDQMIEAGAIPSERRLDAPLIAWSSVHGLSVILTASAVPPIHDEQADRSVHREAIDRVLAGVLRAIS